MRIRGKYIGAGAKPASKGWPVVVYVWIVGLGLLSYIVVGELMLIWQPHPWHWLSGLGGSVVGYFAGWQWYRHFGDVL